MDGISSQAVAVRDGCCDGNVTLNVAPKQEGAQGFYKVWVSDTPIEASGRR